MTDATPPFRRAITAIHSAAMTPITVWIAFILVHLWLGLLNLYAPGLPLGDVTNVYRYWMDLGLGHSFGLLAPGYAADAVLLDHQWQVTSVWAAGLAL